MKTNILFLGINARYTHTCLSLYYLRNCLDPQKHEYMIIEKTINDPLWDVITTVNMLKFDILCISCYIWNQHYVQCILKDIKKTREHIKIVCGGPDISYNAEKWLALFPAIDYIITGPGESAFELLLKHDFTYPQKIISVKNKSLSQLPFPYIPDDKPELTKKYIYYEASRGCPSHCSYCISSIDDQVLEFKDLKTIKDDILKLLAFEPLMIKFVDRSFNANNDLCLKILRFIKTLKTDIKFHFELNPALLTKEQIKELTHLLKTNRIQIEIGLQTIHDKTYKRISRNGNWKDIKKNIGDSFLNLENVHFDMMVGLPGEKTEDVITSFNRIIELNPYNLKIGFLKILPGTQIEKEVDKWGYQYQEYAPYRVYSSKTMSHAEINLIGLLEIAIDLVFNSQIMRAFNNRVLSDYPCTNFQYYASLAYYFHQNNVNKSLSDKQKIFYYVKDHFDFHFKGDNREYFLDALRFDWFWLQDTHFYPDFLEAKHCDIFKSDLYVEFKEKWQALQKEKSPEAISKKMKNAVFYTIKHFESDYDSDGVVKVDGVMYNVYLDDEYHIKRIAVGGGGDCTLI